jgi:competence protein ComEC
LDVGQGDACVIELPDHQTILIDGGGAYDTLDMGRAVVGPFLWDRGIRRLDHVIATHPQLDHVGGLAWVVRKFQIGRYWSNGLSRTEPFYRYLQAGLEAQGLTEQIAEAGRLIIDAGPCRLRILNPPAADPAPNGLPVNVRSGTTINNLSVVTRLDCGPHSFLFTGDIEGGVITRLHADPWFTARIVKVPHHGARSSLHTDWVGHSHPDIAVISVGRTNSYGHPANAVLAAYEENGIRVFRTDRDGAVQFTATLSSPETEMSTVRGSWLRPTRIGPAMLNAEVVNVRKLWGRWLKS